MLKISFLLDLDKETFDHLWNLAKLSRLETGLTIVDMFEYWEKESNFTDPWFKNTQEIEVSRIFFF